MPSICAERSFRFTGRRRMRDSWMELAGLEPATSWVRYNGHARPVEAALRVGESLQMFLQLLANGLVTGSVIALAAAGVSVVYGVLRLVNFAYGDYMTFGAFIAVYFNVTLELPIVTAAVLAMGATALLSVALELVLWRALRARDAGFMSLFLVSIGLDLVLS